MASKAFRVLIENLQRTSRIDANVLISGEVGTGRRQCAVSIHQASTRSRANFVSINCTALDDHRFALELFGSQSINAELLRKGALFLAEGGVLFLQEVDELSLNMQAQLTRFIDSAIFTPVGGADAIPSDVRIICSTSKNLKELVETGRFRNDLFHLISQLVINVPTLNERIDDMELLVANVLREISPGHPYQIDKKAINRLTAHSFSGNLIELKNILVRAVSISSGAFISESNITQALTNGFMTAQSGDIAPSITAIEHDFTRQNLLDSSSDTGIKSNEIEKETAELGKINLLQSRKRRWDDSDVTVDDEAVEAKLNEFTAASTQHSVETQQDNPLLASNERRPSAMSDDASRDTQPTNKVNNKLSLKERELIYIKELMDKFQGDKDRVAKELGCTVRTLYRKLDKIKAAKI